MKKQPHALRVEPPFGVHASLMQVNLHATLLDESTLSAREHIARCAFLYVKRGGLGCFFLKNGHTHCASNHLSVLTASKAKESALHFPFAREEDIENNKHESVVCKAQLRMQ